VRKNNRAAADATVAQRRLSGREPRQRSRRDCLETRLARESSETFFHFQIDKARAAF
jgi:hypothetical protein